MFNIVLYQPEIPPNTGNIIRLCANTGVHLHLVEPLGFHMDNRELRRAGLDYHEYAEVEIHSNLEACLTRLAPTRLFVCSSKAQHPYHQVNFMPDDTLLFGSETSGLPQNIFEQVPPKQRIVIPMCTKHRSLNLANAAAIIVYEALRQNKFKSVETSVPSKP